MKYYEFCNFQNNELPFNRKERFYTGTVLPALLFHKGLSNFYTFLRQIKGFPLEINEAATKDYFLFYTEYNLKESAGERSVGRKIYAPTNETPDVVIEILKPVKVFIIIEAKMFENTTTTKVSNQIKRQEKYVGEVLQNEFKLQTNQIFHIALVPKKLGISERKYFRVINWDIFLEDQFSNLTSCYFYNYLKFSLENYDDLVSIRVGPDTTGLEIYKLTKQGERFWVGREGGADSIDKDGKNGSWAIHEYYTNPAKPKSGRRGNWITNDEFVRIICRHIEKREDKGTTRAGFINPNQQKNLGKRQPPLEGTDNYQYVYVMNCTKCGLIYGANGSDIHLRKCPNCQGGKPGNTLPVN